jgi:hypothetical protein
MGNDLFESLADQASLEPDVTRGTMMGFPCLRVKGAFFASLDAKSGSLVLKLPRARVDELTGEGRGLPFAPNGRVFKEWVLLPDSTVWQGLLSEAKEFVRNG